MNCIEFRRMLASEPMSRDPGFVVHGDSCAGCRPALQQAREFEAELRVAMSLPAPEGLADRILLAHATRHRRQRWRQVVLPGLAMAASLVMAVLVGVIWFDDRNRPDSPQRSQLADLAVEHLDHEPYALEASSTVPEALLERTLRTLGMGLEGSPGAVQYMAVCPMGPHRTLHLVTQTELGPVTLLFVPRLKPDEMRIDFRRDEMLGREFELAGGAMVLLAENDSQFDVIEQRWRAALQPVTEMALGSH